ncbi:DNA cytosine methyltransferase [Streptomyces sp. WAC 01529]|nr:DNA cytosine methyltransferase [Streptomyces sp. WAC 01529]AZM57652.1 DNA cytosine methyltransferase [Streptomyces sp. WAC 01529]
MAGRTAVSASLSPTPRLSSLELCAGAGGLALGLEYAGFAPALLIDNRPVALDTLRLNRPDWRLSGEDLCVLEPSSLAQDPALRELDLISGGLPRLKASAAVARERGNDHELAVFHATLDLTRALRPRALLIENVPDLATNKTYAPLREHVRQEMAAIGYSTSWFVLNAAHHGVPQDRKQGVLVAFASPEAAEAFRIPPPHPGPPVSVGQALGPSMAARGWPRAAEWAAQAKDVAPTLVGGSWERGGADLGPTGSKRAWARIGVDGGTVANEVPGPDFAWNPAIGRDGMMALTVEQAAILQGFPKDWEFAGRKTARYRQVGHASPPPVGEALGRAISAALAAV